MSQRKPPHLRQNRETQDVAIIANGPWTSPPLPRDEWYDDVKAEWVAYWKSDLAKIVADTDVPALERLFALRQTRLILSIEFDTNPTTIGSRGNTILNPAGREIGRIDGEIRQLEDRFGLNPKSRLTLGITVGEAVKSLDELADRMRTHAEEAEDPRLSG